MTARLTEQLSFPKGRMPVYGINAINTDADRVTAAEQVAILNDPENLQAIVTNPERTILHKQLPDGTHISLLRPTGPYSNRALMSGMYDKELKEEGVTHFVYDYPTEDQRQYWALAFAGLHAGRQILEEEGREEQVANLYAENVVHVSDISQRTSRTIRFPHGHFVEFDSDPEVIHPTTSAIHHLQEEQDVLERRELVERFWVRVLQRMPEEIDSLLPEFDVRYSAPFGYQFSLDGVFNRQNIDRLTQVLALHHETYKQVADLVISAGRRAFSVSNEFRDRMRRSKPGDDAGQKKVIKGSSYRLYLALNGGKLDVIICPEFWSHGGVMEATGVNLDRDPSHKEFPMEQRKDFEDKFAEKVSTMLNLLPATHETG